MSNKYNTKFHLKNHVKRLNNLASSFYLILAKRLDQYVNIGTRFLQISNKNILLHYSFLNGKWYNIKAKFIILVNMLLLASCIVSENPGPGYINPRYPAAAPYGYNPYQQPSYVTPAPATPGSRYYNNPYDFPQPNYYQYYDSDRYYKPPNSYETRYSTDSR